MSLKKIAEMVGVSPSTVSRVLNNTVSTCASPELKEKIWEAAHSLNYVPNANARNLKTGRQAARIIKSPSFCPVFIHLIPILFFTSSFKVSKKPCFRIPASCTLSQIPGRQTLLP